MMKMPWRTDRLYTYVDAGLMFIFHSPDGEGMIYHPTMNEAKNQTGLSTVHYLSGIPDEAL